MGREPSSRGGGGDITPNLRCTSEGTGWKDDKEQETVLFIEGKAFLRFETGNEEMECGSYIRRGTPLF